MRAEKQDADFRRNKWVVVKKLRPPAQMKAFFSNYCPLTAKGKLMRTIKAGLDDGLENGLDVSHRPRQCPYLNLFGTGLYQ